VIENKVTQPRQVFMKSQKKKKGDEKLSSLPEKKTDSVFLVFYSNFVWCKIAWAKKKQTDEKNKICLSSGT